MPIQLSATIEEARAWRDETAGADGEGRVIGLVPTMGFLHEGHLSLVHRSAAECSATAASVFVNPSQFGPGEDLESYPRDLDRDIALLEGAGCDFVFAPTASEMYPPGYQTWVEIGSVSEPLEGRHRPGHFRGVATVVLKLLQVFQPRRAYFGQKDVQQLVVIETMVRDLNVPVDIVACPTIREPDGLAMSSRNTYLSPTERVAATVLYRALTAARDAYEAGEREADRLRHATVELLSREPLADVEYVSVADALTMEELDEIDRPAVASLAVRIGRTRLIDNIRLGDTSRAEAE